MSRFELTEAQIKAWGGEQLFNEAAQQYYRKGEVLSVKYEEPYGKATLCHAGHTIATRFKSAPGAAWVRPHTPRRRRSRPG